MSSVAVVKMDSLTILRVVFRCSQNDIEHVIYTYACLCKLNIYRVIKNVLLDDENNNRSASMQSSSFLSFTVRSWRAATVESCD